MQSVKHLGRRWFDEVWNRHRREAIPEMMAPDALLHDAGNDSVGRDAFYQFFDRLSATFSDMRLDVQDMIADGDRVCVRWSCKAKHTGDGLGSAPTNKTITVTGLTVFRVADEMIVEAWQNWDMLGLLRQIQPGDKTADKAATYIA